MKKFDKILLRLKEQLGLSTDKDVADVLGMTNKAFISRKGRDSFPEDKLLALKAKRPDLQIDDTYILTGVKKESPERHNVELARRVSVRADRGVEGEHSNRLLEGLNKVAEAPGGYVDPRAELANLVASSKLEMEDLEVIRALVERLSNLKKEEG